MRTTRFATVLMLGAALAACEQSNPTHDITGPRPGSALLDASAGDRGLAPVFDNSYDAADASILQLATGGKASGHFELGAPFGAIAEERYSFTAQTTTFPLAKGNLEIQYLDVAGNTAKVHSDVTCMSVVDNQAYIGGRARKVWINNQQQPGLEGVSTIWRVQDNGEGANSPPDLGSLIFFFADEQAHCALQFQLPMTPSANGNIQVSSQ
jgi:hypothetical protein